MKVALTPQQAKWIAGKMKSGGYLSEGEIVREALRVAQLNEQEDGDPALEAALRHALRSPLRKYRPGHLASLARLNSARTRK